MNMSRLIQYLQGPQKVKIFTGILAMIIVVGTLLSLLTRITLLNDDVETRPRLAVVGPLQSPAGLALKQGASLFIEQLNSQGGYQGRALELLEIEQSPAAAQKVIADKRVVGVIGYLDAAQLSAAAPIFSQAKLPVVTPLFLHTPLAGVTSMGLNPGEEARFVANYARNIQQQRLMYVIREADSAFDPLVDPFLEVYQRFDTPVQKVWTLPTDPNDAAAQKVILDEISQLDVGALYIATRPERAARFLHDLRNTGSTLEVFGPSQLATHSFSHSLKSLSGKEASLQSDGIIAATPVLFDTANDDAQRFQTRYQQLFQASPDWLATFAADAARIVLSAKPGVDRIKGITGDLNFIAGQAQLPIQMGAFNGDSLISAPVQLLPIAKGTKFNYIDALRQGRVLYVNDRFMFKTNVVYVGFEINDISNVDRQKETATLDMSIWFRYRGKFDPQDLEILNALEPVKFGTPEEIKESEEVQYRRYRIKQTFKLNFTRDKRTYNHHVAGISFRHRMLNRNNLMYVVDVLGMPTGNALLDDLRQRRVAKAGAGWMVDNAWVSQELMRERGNGAPQYVGMSGEQPLFSTITAGIVLKPENLAARDIFDGEYFIYIAIFGFLGVLVAIFLDMRKLFRYWALQSWLLRLVFWPMLLLALGNLIIDWSFAHWAPMTTRVIVTIYETIWWLLAAALIDMAVRRFIWLPLENKTGHKVPNVMKFLVTILIFAFAIAGIIAMVYNHTLTSLLATSGVLAMIIGLAVQANIANIFSGIILNIERPFKVGDYIKINNVIGQVKDITWRTVRVESNDGPMVSLANSKVSEAFMENYSVLPHGIMAETLFYTPPETDPDTVIAIINEAIQNSASIIYKDDPAYAPEPRFKGIVNVNGQWVALFAAGYRVKILPKKGKAKQELWQFVRQKFVEQGIPLLPVNNSVGLPTFS